MRKERPKLQLWGYVIGISFFLAVVGRSEITLDVVGDGLVRSLVGGVYAWIGWFLGRLFEQQLHDPGPGPEPINPRGVVVAIVVSAVPFFGLIGGLWLAVNTELGGWGYVIRAGAAFAGLWLLNWGMRGLEVAWKMLKGTGGRDDHA